jgi:hypothetical protein
MCIAHCGATTCSRAIGHLRDFGLSSSALSALLRSSALATSVVLHALQLVRCVTVSHGRAFIMSVSSCGLARFPSPTPTTVQGSKREESRSALPDQTTSVLACAVAQCPPSLPAPHFPSQAITCLGILSTAIHCIFVPLRH